MVVERSLKALSVTLFNTAHIFIVRYILSKCATNNSSHCQHAQLVHCIVRTLNSHVDSIFADTDSLLC